MKEKLPETVGVTRSRMSPFTQGRRTALLSAMLLLPAAPLTAQYFGRNKVEYDQFKFGVLQTEHFDVYSYPDERGAAAVAGRMAERWYARYTKLFNYQLRGRQVIILYASHPEFEQTNAIPGDLGEGTGGVTEVLKRRIVLPIGSSLAQTDHVIGHELVHAFQYDMTGQGLGVGFQLPGAARLPLWFIEGMAEYLSIGPVDPNTAMWLRDATEHKKLPSMRQLYDPRYFPYRYGQAFWAFIAAHRGESAVGEILRRAGRSGDAELALLQVMGIRADSLAKEWHHELEEYYAPVHEATERPQVYGHVLIGRDTASRLASGLNVAPALSPDGSRLAFFSERDLFSIDLYLANATTGQVTHRIVQTALDPHYQSLEFISSSGAWNAAGDRLAIGAVLDGHAALTVVDVARGRKDAEIRIPEVGEIFNPTWSPDGRYIAFAALANGFSDLFRYDLVAKRLERLTNDPYADLEPAWSPDGKQIVFVTDQFTTRLDNLDYNGYGLALLDVQTGAIRPLETFPNVKSINPQWSPDGRSIYFVSDRNGISNIYRLDVASGAIAQITNLYTGVSGITDVSPAISVASQSGRLVFDVYERAGYSLYAIDSASTLAGFAPTAELRTYPAALPPADRVSDDLVRALHDPTTGLPVDTTFPVRNYSASMSLDYVSQPSIAVGADRFGTYVGGGMALFWSDMLGNHNLVTAAQVDGGFRDFSGLVAYENTTHRWNWGVAAQQIPYYSGAYGIATGTVGGEPSYIEEVDLYRQTNREVDVMASYPFSPAARVEFSAGFTNISFDEQIEQLATDASSGYTLYDSLTTIPGPPDINVATATAAFVYDNAFFGATSPILGERYRFEVTPAVGTINWVTVLADYRRYFMPVRPFTFAFRLMTYGRYGSGADDARLTPLYLGYASLVRGYDIGSYSTAECPQTGNTCPAFDRLLGSQLFVGNAEIRFPLLGVLGAGRGYYGAFPVEAAFFADGGKAYCPGSADPNFCVGDNKAVYSAGVALRINVLGYAVGEIDLVRPFQRPDKGWYVELSLTPGF